MTEQHRRDAWEQACEKALGELFNIAVNGKQSSQDFRAALAKLRALAREDK